MAEVNIIERGDYYEIAFIEWDDDSFEPSMNGYYCQVKYKGKIYQYGPFSKIKNARKQTEFAKPMPTIFWK